jgi:hypothetical protein
LRIPAAVLDAVCPWSETGAVVDLALLAAEKHRGEDQQQKKNRHPDRGNEPFADVEFLKLGM